MSELAEKQYTPEQIDQCCNKLDKMCLAMTGEKTALVIALEIIRQLQNDLAGGGETAGRCRVYKTD